MFSDDECLAQLLDEQFGLLSPEESQALRAVLAAHPRRVELEARAAEEVRLLKAAAQQSFPEITFTRPAEATVSPLLPLSPEERRRSIWMIWVRWAVAAAVLLAVAGLSVPVARGLIGLSQANRQVADARQQFEAADGERHQNRKSIADNQSAYRRWQRESRQKASALMAERLRRTQAVNAQPLDLIVIGPAALQPGAPNEYRIETKDAATRAAPAQVAIRVFDKNHPERDVFAAAGLASTGNLPVVLPVDLPLKSDSDLYLEVVATGEGGQRTQLREKVRLAGPIYLTHLTTDKPLYQPGELVYFRSLTVDRGSFRPPDHELRLKYVLTGPLGQSIGTVVGTDRLETAGSSQPVLGPDGQPLHGVGCGAILLPANAPGGEYKLTVEELSHRFQPVTCKVTVAEYRQPVFEKELEFSRKTYGPGEEVVANVQLRKAGRPVAGTRVNPSVTVDGKPLVGPDHKPAVAGSVTDANGAAVIRFKLPVEMERGNVVLTVMFPAANGESLLKPVPVLLKKVFVEFYPEGGELLAGVPQRVYFQARNTLGQPASVRRAHLVDGTGRTVRIVNLAGQDTTVIETLADDKQPGIDQGQGAFTFAPRAGQTYELKVVEPAGLTVVAQWPGDKPNQTRPKPIVRTEGVALRVLDGVTVDKQPIRVSLSNVGPARKLLVGAYCRGRVIDQKWVAVGANQSGQVVLKSASGLGGVLRLTVFEQVGDKLQPRAERLIYRRPAGKLQFTLSPDKLKYAPGEKVHLSVSAATETGRPAAAVVMVGVVNNGTVTLADDKTYRSLPTQLLVAGEVRKPGDLEHADVLLGNHPKAAMALDLLLGTQGWRRFIEQSEQPPIGEDARRLVMMTGQAVHPLVSRKQEMLAEIDAQIGPALREAQADEKKAQHELQSFEFYRKGFLTHDRELAATAEKARADYHQAQDVRDQYLSGLRIVGLIALPVLVLAALVGLVGKLTGRRSQRWALPLTSAALVLLLVVGLGGVWIARTVSGPRTDLRSTADAIAFPPAPQPAAVGAAQNELRPGAPKMAPFGGDMHVMGGAGPLAAPRGVIPVAPRANRRQMDRQPQGIDAPEPPAIAPAEPGPLLVREYAHVRTAPTDQREDFTETVLWKPVLVLPQTGRATVDFQLSDAIASYRVILAGHTLDGRLGEVHGTFAAVKPLSLDAKLPVELTAGDTLDLPVTLANDSDTPRSVRLTVKARNAKLTGPAGVAGLQLAPRQTGRRIFRLKPAIVEGKIDLILDSVSEPFARDSVALSVPVVAAGFPIVGAKSDVLEHTAIHTVTLPATWVKGTLKMRVDVFPSTLAELQKGLAGLLREPGGCFEQSSSSNYPNVLILNYLRESDQANPEALKKARELLDRGYRQLTRFECQKPGDAASRQGYEWFGGAVPPHEALTAYGLLEFGDMAKVYDVDRKMVARTRAYLLSRRDGQGGFLRNTKALDRFGRAPADLTDAYIVWALTESDPAGKDDLSKELAALAAKAQGSKDPYFLSLVANALLNRNQRETAVALLERVAALQQPTGQVDGARTSITNSGGRDLQIETTALAVLGWLKANRPEKFARPLQAAVKWIGQQRGGYGSFGATQSTILALKALIAWTKANKQTPEAGVLTVSVAGKVVGRQPFAAGTADTISVDVPDAERVLRPGANEVRIEIDGKYAYPYTLSWSYHSEQPLSAKGCPVRLTTKLDRAQATEGEPVRLTAVVDNQAGQAQGMTVAVIGLPAGLKVPEDQKELKQLALPRETGTQPGTISAYEIRGRELVLYWRTLPPGQREVSISLICHVPGEFHGPASRAYLYYNADVKDWVAPLAVTIAPAAGK